MAAQTSAKFTLDNKGVPNNMVDWSSFKLDSIPQPSSNADVDSYLDVYNLLGSFCAELSYDPPTSSIPAPPLTLNRDQFPGRIAHARPDLRSLDPGLHSNFNSDKESYDFSRLASPQPEENEIEMEELAGFDCNGQYIFSPPTPQYDNLYLPRCDPEPEVPRTISPSQLNDSSAESGESVPTPAYCDIDDQAFVGLYTIQPDAQEEEPAVLTVIGDDVILPKAEEEEHRVVRDAESIESPSSDYGEEDNYVPPDDDDDDDDEYIPSRSRSNLRRKITTRKAEKPYQRLTGKRVRFLSADSDGSSEQSVVTSSSSSSDRDAFISSLADKIKKTSKGCPKCPLCDHVQLNKRMPDLRRHMRTHNPEERKYTCPACETELTRKDAYRRHCISKHDEVFPLPDEL